MGRRSPRPHPQRLAEKLLAVRNRLELSQEQMALAQTPKDSHYHDGNIYKKERGTREPSLLVILRYAQLSGISTDVLINDELSLPDALPHRTHKQMDHVTK